MMLCNRIYRAIDPPFEELFDEVEEHIVELLVTPWAGMKISDKSLYDRVSCQCDCRWNFVT